MTLPLDTRSPFRSQRWIECKNIGATTLTAFSVAEIVEASRPEQASTQTPEGGRTVLHVRAVTADSRHNTAIIGPLAIAQNKFGTCTLDFPAYVQVQTGTPANGETWGPKNGDLGISSGQSGFTILGDYDNGLVRVIRQCSAGLVELCAQENASRNTPYDCLLGTWDPDTNLWCYTDAETVTAIDHRIGPPLAEIEWKGLYQEMPSTTYGRIFVCVSLDCELPPEGCNTC